MKRVAPERRPVTLTIAGSDSGGGAGIQADLKTMEATGSFATSVVTAVTAQNTAGVESSYVLPIDEIDAQCEAVFADFDISAIKTGMLATAGVIDTVTERVATADAPAVVDPVMIAATGDRLLDPDAESAYQALIAESTLVTPNADEATVLTDIEIESIEDAQAAGEALVTMGADAALVKGGHLDEDADTVVDTLVTDSTVERFEHPRIDTSATHGSGCTISSAIAARFACGDDLSDAVEWSTEFMQRAVRYNHSVGHGPGAVHHLVDLRDRAHRWSAADLLAAVADRIDKWDGGRIHLAAATPFAETVDGIATSTIGPAGNAVTHPQYGVETVAASHLLGARDVTPSIRLAATADGSARILDSVATTLRFTGEDDRRTVAREALAEAETDPELLAERGDADVRYSVFASSVDELVSRLSPILE